MKTVFLIVLALAVVAGIGLYGQKMLDFFTGNSAPSMPRPTALKFNAPRF